MKNFSYDEHTDNDLRSLKCELECQNSAMKTKF